MLRADSRDYGVALAVEMSDSARLTTMTPMMTPTVIRWAFLFPMSMTPLCGMPRRRRCGAAGVR